MPAEDLPSLDVRLAALGAENAELRRRLSELTPDPEKRAQGDTEQLRIQQELRQSEQRYRQLLDRVRVIAWEADPASWRFTFVSGQAEAILGYPLDAWQKPYFWVAHLHPDDRDRAVAFRRQRAQEGGSYELEYRLVSANGETVWVQDIVTVELDGARPVRLAGVLVDITHRKLLELDRQLIERKLLETQKLESLGILAGGIAHDFNNLLTSILGYASLCQMELPATSPVLPYLEQITAASRQAADLCRQMLAYSGKGRFVMQHVNLSQLIKETTPLLHISISKKAALSFHLAEKVPSILVDATQMRQIVMNLVLNASEAIGDRSGLISISTGVARPDSAYLADTHLAPELPEGDYIFLEVSDNGCGMTPETRARIFDPFFTTKFTGRGLGLAAVQGIVRSHKGAIKVYSEANRGSTFKILLPCVEGAADAAACLPRLESTWRGQGTILIADDEGTVRALTARMLEAQGFQVILAEDGQDALNKFRQQPELFRVVLLDLTMPHLGGEETFRELRGLRPDVGVILMSGYTEQEVINRFAGKGLAGFLQKPFTPGDLLHLLRRVLRLPEDKPGHDTV